jgi:hypothetical protein
MDKHQKFAQERGMSSHFVSAKTGDNVCNSTQIIMVGIFICPHRMQAYYTMTLLSICPCIPSTLSFQFLNPYMRELEEAENKERSQCAKGHITRGTLKGVKAPGLHVFFPLSKMLCLCYSC